MKDISKWIVYGGVFATPFIVLIIANSMFFPFITGKNFTFRIIVEIIFAAWVILALYEPKYRPKTSWILGSFTMLLVVMFAANLQGQSPHDSFWSNFERMEGYVTLVHAYLYMLVVGSVLTTRELWNRYFNITIAVAVILSLYAFAQLSGNITINQGGWRLDGTLGNSAYMAIYMLFHVFITLFMLLRTENKGMRYVYGALALLFIYLLVQTATRGTILGLVGGLFVMVTYIALFTRRHPRMQNIAIGGVIAIIVVVGLFIKFKDTAAIQNNPYLQRVASISLNELSTRLDIWGMAFNGVKERPLLGWGQSNFNYVFNTYYDPKLFGQEAWFDRVHDIVMDWLIAGGILGALAYFSIFFSAVYYLFFRPLLRKNDDSFTVIERGVLLGLLAGYLVHNIVVFDNIVSYMFYAMILAYVHARVSTPVPSFERAKIDVQIVEQVAVPVVAIAALITVYYVNVPSIQAARDVIVAFKASTSEDMLAEFDTALARGSLGTQEIREQLTQRAQSVLQNKEISEAEKKKVADRVEAELLKQVEEKPGDARVEVFLSSFYRMIGDPDKAIVHLETARALSPKKQLIIFEQGFAYLQKQEYAKAMEYFKEAYELAPQFTEPRVNYAMAAIYNDHPELLDELIQTPEQKQMFAINQYAVQAAFIKKMYPLLVDMFKIQIERNPTDVQIRTNYAFILNELGDTQDAIDALTQAGQDIPSFKTQADQFILGLQSTSTKK